MHEGLRSASHLKGRAPDAVIALSNRTNLWHACQIAAIELAIRA
jgi:hypothetical protein